MQGFILKRLLQAVITLFILTIIVFLVVRATGDPMDVMVPTDAPEEIREAMREKLGLNESYPSQYWTFITDAVTGDFGESIRYKQPVMDLLEDRLPDSLKLAVVGMVLAILLSIPLGVLAAVRRGTWLDKGASTFAVVGVTTPSFLVGILLIEFISVRWELLPTAGMGDWKHYIMPAFTMSLPAVASMTRLLRSSMIDALESDYIKLARLKGIPERVVVWKHALRNSVVSVVTMGGIYLASMVTMAVIVETVFAWPGIGRLSYEAIIGRDYPVVQAIVIVAGALVIMANLMVDIAYGFLDPRIRHR